MQHTVADGVQAVACAMRMLLPARCGNARLVDSGERHVLVRGGGDGEDVRRQLPVARAVVLEHGGAAVDGQVLEGVDRDEDRAHLARPRPRLRARARARARVRMRVRVRMWARVRIGARARVRIGARARVGAHRGVEGVLGEARAQRVADHALVERV